MVLLYPESYIAGPRRHGAPGKPTSPPQGGHLDNSPLGSRVVSVQVTQSLFPTGSGVTQAMGGTGPAPPGLLPSQIPQAPLGLSSSF